VDTSAYDVVIVGAGAAGLMTAIACGRENQRKILLLNSTQKIGSKILISGGTRCNVTNRLVDEQDYCSGNQRLVRNVLRGFPAEKAARFFEEAGVQLVSEKDGKLFPKSQSARTVLEALLAKIKDLKITVEIGRKVTGLRWQDGLFILYGNDLSYTARTVVLCTGGLSYPETGSDGSGYGLAMAFGHTMVPTFPSLTPLFTSDDEWKKLTGLAVPCRLTLWTGDKKSVSFEGPFLFTHTGFSGPSVLNLSRHWIAAEESSKKVTADFMPDLSEAQVRDRLFKVSEHDPRSKIKNILTAYFPERMAEVLLRKAGVPADVVLNQLKKEERENLVRVLTRCPLEVSGAAGYGKAEVTAGGICLEEVDPRTLESKLRPGLFFAGEILDVDGRIGGFNFQWAWSSAVAVSGGIKKIFNAGRKSGEDVS
jgi:predicted Rossmann fold flavoprotein